MQNKSQVVTGELYQHVVEFHQDDISHVNKPYLKETPSLKYQSIK